MRLKTISVSKEDGFVCGKCGAKGNCDDSKELAIKNKKAMYWDEKAGEYGKIVCLKCGHLLETKEELEMELKVIEIQQYGFWLRLLSEHFRPCPSCQEKLHKLLLSKEMHIGNEEKPPIELWRLWEGITIEKKPNNAFCKEYCVICARWFDADLDYIYDCQELNGYVCYDCAHSAEKLLK